MIDMSNPDVVNYLDDSLSTLFEELNPDYIYQIEMKEQENAQLIKFSPCSGKKLMEEGLDLDSFHNEKNSESFKNGIYSRMLYISKKA